MMKVIRGLWVSADIAVRKMRILTWASNRRFYGKNLLLDLERKL